MSAAMRITVAALALGIALHPARAQQAGPSPARPSGDPQQLEIFVTPYLWTPWLTTEIDPKRPDLHSQTDTIGADQLLSHLTWVPFMGEAEFRSGSFGVLLDYVHTPLKAGVNTRDIAFGGATTGFTMDTGTALFLYRPISEPMQKLDLGLGLRAWGFKGDVTLSQAALPSVSVSKGDSWADPLLALRYRRELGDGFSATFYGDVGGFGAGASIDWQAVATVDYAVNPGTDIHLGFRSLNFEYTAEKARFNVHMYGPIVAATFRLYP